MFPRSDLERLLEVSIEKRSSCRTDHERWCVERAITEMRNMLREDSIDYRKAWIVLMCITEGGLV
jgi:hypothetical protein